MFKIEDATHPDALKPKARKRVFTIEATEGDFDRLCDILAAADPMTQDRKDERLFNDFVHSMQSACCW